MSKGHTSMAALGAARIALLAGVSVAAIFAAGSAYAQTTTSFDNGGQYAINGSNPIGADFTNNNQMPGLGAIATTGANVLTDGNGVIISSSMTGVINDKNGTPVLTTYASENPSAAITGTGVNANKVLTIAAGGALADPASLPPTFTTDGGAPSGYTWADLTANDPNHSYSWTTATYSQVAPADAYKLISGKYVLLADGTFLTTTQATALGITHDSGTATYATISGEVPAGTLGGKVLGSNALPNNQLLSGYYNFNTNGVVGNPTPSGNYTITTDGSVVYGNSATDTTSAIGPDGATFTGATVTVTDGAGSTTTITNGDISNTGKLTVGGLATLNGGLNVTGGTTTDTLNVTGATTTNGITNTGNVTTDSLTVNNNATVGGTLDVTGKISGNGGLAILGGTTTDTLTVTGATATHGINNSGDINNNGDIKTTTLHTTGSATIGGQAFLTGGATVSNNLTVAPGTDVSMGNNAVHDVGTPVFATDATNKAYVDKGLNKAYEGTAIALAISQPVFLPGQTFAMRAGWGTYEGQNAFGASVAGVIARGTFGYGSTVALDGGIGMGEHSGVAGKAGLTVGFGGGSAPLK